jgi:hypothetical protein
MTSRPAPIERIAGEQRATVRAVTVIMGTVVGLSFLFGFGNVWALGVRLGVPVFVAPLVAPAVDLSVVGLLLAIRFLALYGAGQEQLRPARRLLVFASVVTLALNVAEPVIAGEYGKAAFDSVGCLLLIGWAEVGPGLLQAMSEAAKDRYAAGVRGVPPQSSPAHAAVTAGGGEGSDGGMKLPRQRRVGTSRPARVSEGSEDLLVRARAEDTRHWELHRRPISAEALRKRLRVGAARSRDLVAQMREEAQSALDGHRVDGGVAAAASLGLLAEAGSQ